MLVCIIYQTPRAANFIHSLWLTQLHSELQDSAVRMDGFDIDIAQCPPAAWMPPNIHFSPWNVVHEPPKELLGQFDLVHLRLVMIGIENEDVSKLVANLAGLLSRSSVVC